MAATPRCRRPGRRPSVGWGQVAMTGYVFYCSRCQVSHSGECPTVATVKKGEAVGIILKPGSTWKVQYRLTGSPWWVDPPNQRLYTFISCDLSQGDFNYSPCGSADVMTTKLEAWSVNGRVISFEINSVQY